MDEIIETYECGCNPDTLYKTRQTFRNHFGSNRHRSWEHQKDILHLREKVAELENRLSSASWELEHWKEVAIRYKRQFEPKDLLD